MSKKERIEERLASWLTCYVEPWSRLLDLVGTEAFFGTGVFLVEAGAFFLVVEAGAFLVAIDAFFSVETGALFVTESVSFCMHEVQVP